MLNSEDFNDPSVRKKDASTSNSTISITKSHKYTNQNKFSFRQFLTNSFLVSLPHLAILFIFLLYVLLGAAILKEIESDRPLVEELISSQTTSDTSNLNFNKKINQYTQNLNNLYATDLNQLSEYNDRLTASSEKFLAKFNKIKGSALDVNQNDLNLSNKTALPTPLMKNFYNFYDKKKKKINVTEMFKAIAQNLIDFKKDLKENFCQDLNRLFQEYQAEQNELNLNLDDLIRERTINNDKSISEIKKIIAEVAVNDRDTSSDRNDKNKFKHAKWDMRTSIYFMGSLLTTIGYGDVRPYTIIGKLFTMFYVILGIPLTLILLTDLGCIFTRTCKFLYAFLIIFFNDGYYDRIRQAIKDKRKALFTRAQIAASSTSGTDHSTKRTQLRRSKSFDSDQNEEPSLFLSICELASECYKQNDDVFDLSLGFLFSILFSYLTVGAIINSRAADWSLFNGYYFSLITFTKIGLGDLTIENTKFILVSSMYTLFGIAFFDLTIQNLREKIKLVLINNGQNLIEETIKFVNQFGHNWSMESVAFNLGVKVVPQEELSKIIMGKDMKGSESTLKKKSALNDANGHVKKCDKQTQITTLLYTKFKHDKISNNLESSNSVTDQVKIASVKPNNSANSVNDNDQNLNIFSSFNEKNKRKIAEKEQLKPKKLVTEEEFVKSFAPSVDDSDDKLVPKKEKEEPEPEVPKVTLKLNQFVAKTTPKVDALDTNETSVTMRKNRFSAANQSSTTERTTPPLSFQNRTVSSRFLQ